MQQDCSQTIGCVFDETEVKERIMRAFLVEEFKHFKTLKTTGDKKDKKKKKASKKESKDAKK